MSNPFAAYRDYRSYQRNMRWQGYQSIPVEQFGGLDLLHDPGEVGFGGAIDMLDIELNHPGTVRSRDKFSATVANSGLTSPYVVGSGGYFIVSTGASLNLYSGGLIGSAAPPNAYPNGCVQAFGTPSASYFYLSDSAGANAIRRLTTAAVLSAPAGMPIASFLSRSPADNRLVAGPIAGNPHRVQFSNAGDAETWGANNYVDLDPGDSEQITGLATFRELLFVFKQSKFFVFYGTTTDSSGNPIFNYRAFRGNVGNASTPVSADDGIYFFSNGPRGRSIFRTTGGEAVEVGRPVRPMLNAPAPSFFTPGVLTTCLDTCFARGRVHFLLSDGVTATRYVLSYETQSGQWTIWQLPDSTKSISGYQPSGGTVFLVAGVGASAPIHILDPTNAGADSLRTPTPVYRSGFATTHGGAEARIREAILYGTGTVTFQGSNNWGSLNTGESVAMGTSPAIAEGRARGSSFRGRNFSWQVSGAGPWVLDRLELMAAGARGNVEE